MTNLRNRKLYRLTDKRVLGGVCSGLAQYLELPVALVRALAVLALFMSFGLTLIVYVVMCFFIESAPSDYATEQNIGPEVVTLLNQIDAQLQAGELKLRQIERYVTSDTYTINSKFRNL
ncbi:Phage shock protein C [Providencia rustigianii]|uniref:Phage shock protein C n=2 Tax=Providencia rustigianii TaxID=158850 RepID=D1NY28_9GAMM|nr:MULTISPECIES: PspC domain-containing protein [Providencia]EFB73876.1 phage shock protein C [Providencia rustigianii DSM 4541]MTC57269.1 PspC domain-containing protein [Providencia rustigianii]MTC60841.1 PspC domain-containing protein [Providencia rustigianii]SPY77389.1 Phage shock protein C [Providencia rustigianii]SUC26769.1 Phage shock protein C [Providencia rustigianii]